MADKVFVGADYKLYLLADGSILAYCDDFSKKSDQGKVEITSRSSTGQWREYQSTKVKGGTLSMGGTVVRPGQTPSGELSFDELINDWYDNGVDVSAMIAPVDVSGYKEEFDIHMDSMSQEFGGIEDKVSYSIESTINGPVTRTFI